jgi:hypothetical protein
MIFFDTSLSKLNVRKMRKLKKSLKLINRFSVTKKKIVSTLFILFLTLSYNSQILTFDFAGLAGDETSANSNSNDINLNSSSITRGSGLTAAANADRFNATNWAITSIANAVTGNKYMEFTISPQTDYKFTVSSITIQIQRSGTGFSAIALRSSVDSYASNLDGEKTVVDNTSTQSFTFTFSHTPDCNSSITYRLYGFAEATGGTGGPGDGSGNDIIVNGTVTSCGSSNTITTGAITGAAFDVTCSSGDAGSVAFSSSGTFTAGNIYTVQLSNSSGTFGSPIDIGTLTSTSNTGTINITIPFGVSSGTNYRIRIISSTPIVTGSLSSTFTINLTGGPCTPKKPYITSVVLDGCEGSCTEGRTEIVFANSGGMSINTNDANNLNLNYTTNGAQNLLLYFKNGSTITSALNTAAGCAGTFIDGRNTTIPANAKMMFVSDAFCPASYNTWSNFCGVGPIYVLYGQDGASSTADGWVTGGNFGNTSAPNFDLVVKATNGETYRTRYNYSTTHSGKGNGNYVIYANDYSFQESEYPLETSYRAPISDGVLTGCTIIELPIVWGEFRIDYEEDNPVLIWSTLSERNNDYFEVLLSDYNGEEFEKIGRVKGAGSSNFSNIYQYKLKNLKNGIYYTKLKQVDFDGKESFSELIQIILSSDELYLTEIIKASDFIQLKFNQTIKHSSNYKVYDLTGKLLYSDKLEYNSNLISIPNFKGLFLIKIENEYQPNKITKFFNY